MTLLRLNVYGMENPPPRPSTSILGLLLGVNVALMYELQTTLVISDGHKVERILSCIIVV